MTVSIAVQSPLDELLADMIERFRDDRSGGVATYIPELGLANPEWFGVCLVTTEGAIYEGGDSQQPFTIQSISKPFAYALALEKLGPAEVRKRVGVEPSGDAFNSISLQPDSGRPLNPMINAGAIAVSNMVYTALAPHGMERMLDWFGGFAGRQLDIDQKVYESESATGHRNRAIAHLLRNFGVVSDPVEQGLDLYFRQCSILTTARDLAVMAATLANHGVNPVTQKQAMSPKYVSEILSVMTTCGMYNYAGQWLYDVGVPAKSGVAGGILAVLPGRMGIGTFSPRLDAQGNSVRGIRVCQELSERFGLHLFNSHPTARAVVRNEMSLQNRSSGRVRNSHEVQQLKELGQGAILLELQGDLHFSAMEVVQRRIWQKLPGTRLLLIDFSRVDAIDPASADGIARLISRLSADSRQVVFAGLPPDGTIRNQLGPRCDSTPIFLDLDSAIEACENSLLSGKPVSQDGQFISQDSLPFGSLEIAQDLDREEYAHFERLLTSKSFTAGQYICRKGDQASEIYFLVKGMVSVRLSSGPSSFQRLAAFGPNSVFGEIAAIDRGPRSADVLAETDAECLLLSLNDFDRLGVEYPSLKIKLLQYLLRILTTRLRRTNDLVGQLAG